MQQFIATLLPRSFTRRLVRKPSLGTATGRESPRGESTSQGADLVPQQLSPNRRLWLGELRPTWIVPTWLLEGRGSLPPLPPSARDGWTPRRAAARVRAPSLRRCQAEGQLHCRPPTAAHRPRTGHRERGTRGRRGRGASVAPQAKRGRWERGLRTFPPRSALPANFPTLFPRSWTLPPSATPAGAADYGAEGPPPHRLRPSAPAGAEKGLPRPVCRTAPAQRLPLPKWRPGLPEGC